MLRRTEAKPPSAQRLAVDFERVPTRAPTAVGKLIDFESIELAWWRFGFPEPVGRSPAREKHVAEAATSRTLDRMVR